MSQNDTALVKIIAYEHVCALYAILRITLIAALTRCWINVLDANIQQPGSVDHILYDASHLKSCKLSLPKAR